MRGMETAVSGVELLAAFGWDSDDMLMQQVWGFRVWGLGFRV